MCEVFFENISYITITKAHTESWNIEPRLNKRVKGPAKNLYDPTLFHLEKKKKYIFLTPKIFFHVIRLFFFPHD